MYRNVLRAAVELTAASLFVICQFMLASTVLAQAEVVDRLPVGGSAKAISSERPAGGSSQAQLQSELYHQLQVLQQEVLELRGKLDEQAYELKKLKQQRLDDYLDLDRRIGQVSKGSSGSSSVSNSVDTQARVTPGSGSPAPADELSLYREAIDKLLKQQDQPGAITAFSEYINYYPQGRYAANAQYWLGEAYLAQDKLEEAKDWFARLLKEFPSHSKANDARYKLGTVYNLMGDKVKARSLLDEVAQSSGSAASHAKNYIRDNF